MVTSGQRASRTKEKTKEVGAFYIMLYHFNIMNRCHELRSVMAHVQAMHSKLRNKSFRVTPVVATAIDRRIPIVDKILRPYTDESNVPREALGDFIRMFL
jgi:hypothetical protein